MVRAHGAPVMYQGTVHERGFVVYQINEWYAAPPRETLKKMWMHVRHVSTSFKPFL